MNMVVLLCKNHSTAPADLVGKGADEAPNKWRYRSPKYVRSCTVLLHALSALRAAPYCLMNALLPALVLAGHASQCLCIWAIPDDAVESRAPVRVSKVQADTSKTTPA